MVKNEDILGKTFDKTLGSSGGLKIGGFFDFLSGVASWLGKNILSPLMNPYGQENFETQREDNLNKYQNTVNDLESAGFSKWSLMGQNGATVQNSSQATGAGSINPGAIAEIINALSNVKNATVQRDVMRSEIDKAKAEANYTNAQADAVRNGSWFNQQQVSDMERTYSARMEELNLQAQQVRSYVDDVNSQILSRVTELDRKEAELLESIKQHSEENDIQRQRNEIARLEAETNRMKVQNEQHQTMLNIIKADMEAQFERMSHDEKVAEIALAKRKLDEDKEYREQVLSLERAGFSSRVSQMILNGALDLGRFGLNIAQFIKIFGL